MLNRVLVLGDDKKLIKAVEKAAGKNSGLSVVTGEEHAGCGVVAVVAAPDAAAAVVEALRGVSAEHTALFNLLAEAVDAREGHQHGSCARLTDHAVRFGKALKLSDDQLNSLERGALLHDIGKLRVSNDVLMKKNVLSYDEWIELQAHTTKGAELLRVLGFEQDVIDIVQFHHECFDGDGYPEHREREHIPHLAQIMKICDVFTAMTSPRHYRPGVPSIDDGIAHLKSERGKHFNPELIDAFLENEIAKPWGAK